MDKTDIARMNAFFETNHYDADGDAHSVAAAFDPEDDEPKTRAAGIAYHDPDGNVLLVKRHSSSKDYPDHWAFPGGHLEEGETAKQAATRETQEECGHTVQDCQWMHEHHTDDGVHFTTFKTTGPRFKPVLNEEHSAFTWASPNAMPSPLHPGVPAALDADPEEEDGEGNQPDICACKH
jgi:8-oxo-dGTP pyrophosphatase MutT (NUDIX family)